MAQKSFERLTSAQIKNRVLEMQIEQFRELADAATGRTGLAEAVELGAIVTLVNAFGGLFSRDEPPPFPAEVWRKFILTQTMAYAALIVSLPEHRADA